MMRTRCGWVVSLAVLAVASAAFGVETQRQYLSGKGKDDGVMWDFTATASGGAPAAGSTLMNIGKPSKIPVPSNWELQNFGVYTYGRDAYRNGWPKITGHYKTTFTTPADWNGSHIFIVFDGAMTDTAVSINGKSAGPIHQGGYFQFKYDITDLLKAGDNLLEVTVDDESANASVNNAERRGDYWNYGGIFRPVYLEAMPAEHIERIAIDARADGTLNADVILSELPKTGDLLQIRAHGAVGSGDLFLASIPADKLSNHLSVKVPNPKLWTAETPNLYTLEVQLGNGKEIHTVNQKFGFRTIEARAGAGLFVNGQRIILKGADRHSFWPDSGRTLSEKISRDDIALMKGANMNAVRMSHYPPDIHFLDACDELGMYVLDELPGWHAKYDTPIGHKLVEEMVTRDVNHPCILFFDNGNESGWNTALDDDFAKWDIQKRNVLHPWELFRGIDTKHYPDYTLFSQKAAGNNVFFPTEFLHGLYDGGAGAGIEDYWNVVLKSKVAAGGIIWSLVDEDVKRTDLNGKIDSHGNMAPDGITGPYREKEGSYFTLKQIWSPIVITYKDAQFSVENRYSFLDAKDCSYAYELWKYKNPGEAGAGHTVVLASKATVDSIPPGHSGPLTSNLPPAATASYDATAIIVRDPAGNELWTYVWPYDSGATLNRGQLGPVAKPEVSESATALTATLGDLVVAFDKTNGQIQSVTRGGKSFSLVNGPRLVSQAAAGPAPARGAPPVPPAPAPTSRLVSLAAKTVASTNAFVISATYEGAMKSVDYTFHANGWLSMDYAYTLTGAQDFFGVGFDYPEANVKSMRYLGKGPYRVWKNRLAGTTLDVWDKPYNNTVTGDPSQSPSPFEYPEFKGYYAGVRWMQFNTSEGPITALMPQDDLFVQVLTPQFPKPADQGQTGVTFPKAGISFLHAIPPIGSKFVGPKSTGPMGQPNAAEGDYRGSVSLYFGSPAK